jgi:hypothetical protein
MSEPAKLSEAIDHENQQFTSAVRARLRVLAEIPEDALEWLVLEHYQFSCANPALLQTAVKTTAVLAEPGVTRELQRNADEESGHARMYKRAMREIGTDVETRSEFAPTSQFLAKMRELSEASPSRTLGAL